MIKDEVRKGIVNAKFNEESSTFLYAEILVISISMGIWLQSWWIFGGILLALMIGFNLDRSAIILAFVFSILWSAVGFSIGWYLIESTGAAVVICIFVFLASLGMHIRAIQYLKDIDA